MASKHVFFLFLTIFEILPSKEISCQSMLLSKPSMWEICSLPLRAWLVGRIHFWAPWA
jgi:hypothetical protein